MYGGALQTKLTVLLSDCRDPDTLRLQRNNLETAFDELHTKYYQLEGLKDDVSAESEKLDQTESDHQRLMHNISECIRDLEDQKYETRSNASSRSLRSKMSRGSAKSDVSKMSDTAVKKATLKAELKYIDVECKFKAELQKIQTLKQLEIVGAEQAALEAF